MENINKSKTKYYMILGLIFLGFSIPAIINPNIILGADHPDETNYYYPSIKYFMNNLPRIDIKDYPSSTGPLYFLFLAAIGKTFNCGIICFRIINLLISIISIFFLFYYISKKSNNTNAFIFSLCFAFSPYVFGRSIRIATDNFSFLFILISLYYFDTQDRIEIKRFSKATISSFLSIMTRQINIWLSGFGLYMAIKYESILKLKIVKILLSLIPLMLMIPIFLLWKGLVPPQLQQSQQATKLFNSKVFFYIISTIGSCGIFFFFWIYENIKKNSIKILHLLIIVLVALTILTFYKISPSNEVELGALWRLSKITPVFLSVSLPFWLFFPLGLVVTYIIVINEINKKEIFISVILILWIIANLSNRLVLERYYLPFVLFIIGYSFLDSESKPLFYWYGPLVLFGMFLGADIVRYII